VNFLARLNPLSHGPPETEKAPIPWEVWVTLRIGPYRSKELNATPALALTFLTTSIAVIGHFSQWS